MTDHDLTAFAETFGTLRGVFALRGDADELRRVMGLYFKALRRFPLGAVIAGSSIWMERGQRFPKPADWIGAIPRREKITLPEMSHDEAEEYLRAEGLHYEDEPCRCLLCKAAGVDHRFLRYVPDVDDTDRDVRMKIGDRVVVRGHWAHGDQLQRWYIAREKFRAQWQAYGQAKSMPAHEGFAAFAELLIGQAEARCAELENNPPADPPARDPVADLEPADLASEPSAACDESEWV